MAINSITNPSDNPYSTYVGGSSAQLQEAAVDSAQEMSDRFMKLLITQMQNQDPLEPMDNSQMTSQMAQISTVSGINQLNTTMEWLGYSVASLQSTQAASLIGRDMLAPGNQLRFDDDTTSVTGGFFMPQDTVKGSVTIRDATTGAEVHRFDLKSDMLKQGTHTFEWDGKDAQGNQVPAGKYTFQVLASDGTAEAAINTLSITKIVAVQPDPGGTLVIDQYGNSSRLIDVMQVM